MAAPRTAHLRRRLLLAALAAVLGVVGGLVGFAFLRGIALALNLVLRGEVGWEFPELARVSPSPWLIVVAVAGALAIAALRRWEPRIAGHGIPEAMEAVLSQQSRVSLRTAVAKPLATMIAIGTGAPFGAEGPIIVTGGGVGSLLGQVISVTPSERKILLAAGAAAGMSAVFGAPIGAVLLAIELLLFEFSTRAFVPLVIASVMADGIHRVLLGPGPLFSLPAQEVGGLLELPRFALLGVVAGVLGLVVVGVLHRVEDVFDATPWPQWANPAVGALGFALIGLVVPRSLGVGYDVIGEILHGELAAGVLAAVLIAKLAAWWVAMGSGTSGSALAPMLLVGAAAGGLLGTVLAGDGVAASSFALVGMAATFGATAGAPFTAIVLVFELTRDFTVVLPLMLATVAAHLVFTAWREENLMTAKLERRGLHVVTDYRSDVLRETTVGEVMSTEVETFAVDAVVGEVRSAFDHGRHHTYPLVDDAGRCDSVITAEEVLGVDVPDDTPVLDLATRDPVTVAPDLDLLSALRLMANEEVGLLPVVRDEQLVGVCSRTDVLRARERQLRAERLQRGWLSIHD